MTQPGGGSPLSIWIDVPQAFVFETAPQVSAECSLREAPQRYLQGAPPPALVGRQGLWGGGCATSLLGPANGQTPPLPLPPFSKVSELGRLLSPIRVSSPQRVVRNHALPVAGACSAGSLAAEAPTQRGVHQKTQQLLTSSQRGGCRRWLSHPTLSFQQCPCRSYSWLWAV